MSNVSEIREEVSMARQRLETAERKLEQLSNEEEPSNNFCVDGYENIEIDEYSKNLNFKNGCVVMSLFEGNGVIVDSRCVKKIVKDGCDNISIYFKGSEEEEEVEGEVIYNSE